MRARDALRTRNINCFIRNVSGSSRGASVIYHLGTLLGHVCCRCASAPNDNHFMSSCAHLAGFPILELFMFNFFNLVFIKITTNNSNIFAKRSISSVLPFGCLIYSKVAPHPFRGAQNLNRDSGASGLCGVMEGCVDGCLARMAGRRKLYK